VRVWYTTIQYLGITYQFKYVIISQFIKCKGTAYRTSQPQKYKRDYDIIIADL